MAITSSTVSPTPLSISNRKAPNFSLKTHKQPLTFTLSTPLSLKKTLHFRIFHQARTQVRRIYATPEEVLTSDTTPLESSSQIVPTTGGDGVDTIVAVLLFLAFVALSTLTIGAIYLGVTDFLQKRETQKLQKEEESKKGGKKRKLKARAGPRGFGQKVEEADEVGD